MTPSPIDAAREAFEHTRRHLFPAQANRWFALGFVAFLDQCGRSGIGGGPSPGGWNGGRGGNGPDWSEITAWIASHVGLIVIVAAMALTLVVALTALVLWVNTRGVFMYADNVATGRADIGRPWREHAEKAGSLFAWRFALAIGTLVGVLVLLLLGAIAVVPIVKGGGVGAAAVVALIGLAFALVFLVVASALVSTALRDFVAPLQMEAGRTCGDAARVFLGLLRGHPGCFALYVLLKIAFQAAAGLVAVLACCICCCAVLTPVVSQTVLQPLFYFERAWSLHLLRQLGHDVTASEVS